MNRKNRNSSQFQSAQRSVARAFSTGEVEVRFDGGENEFQFDPDNKVIHAPANLPADMNEGDKSIFRGGIDHETLHAIHTDGGVKERMEQVELDSDEHKRMLHNIFQWVEDARIEMEGEKSWKGFGKNLRESRRVLRERGVIPKSRAMELMMYLYDRIRGRNHKASMEVVEDEEMTELIESGREEVDEIVDGLEMESTDDAFSTSEDLFEVLKDEVEDDEEEEEEEDESFSPPDGNGEEEEEEGEDDREEQDKGNNDEEEGKGGGGSFESDEEEKEEEKEEDSGGGMEEEKETGETGETEEDEQEGEEEKTEEMTVSSSNSNNNKNEEKGEEEEEGDEEGEYTDSLIDEIADAELDMSEEVKEMLSENSGDDYRDYRPLELEDETIHIKELVKRRGLDEESGVDVLERMRKTTDHLKSKLWNEFKAQKRVHKTGREKGRLDDNALWKVSAGQSNVFRRRIQDIDFNTSVSLLTDLSGSMQPSKQDKAVCWATALSKTFEEVGIESEMLGFTTKDGMPDYDDYPGDLEDYSRVEGLLKVIMKDYDEDIRDVIRYVNKFVNFYGMMTPDGEAIQWAVRRLMNRREKKKMLIVLTDGGTDPTQYVGCPNGMAFTEEMIRRVQEDTDVMLYGVGINTLSCKHAYDNYSVIHDADKLVSEVYPDICELVIEESGVTV